MRKLALIAPLAAVLAVAGAAQASQPTGSAPNVTVTIGGDLIDEVDDLGERDVQQQADELAKSVSDAMARRGVYPGAQVNLVLTDLKPNRPTMRQTIDKPGLDPIRSISIGGASIEGEIVTAEGERLPVKYERYSTTLADVYGYATWQDAGRAFDRLASNIVAGRLVQR